MSGPARSRDSASLFLESFGSALPRPGPGEGVSQSTLNPFHTWEGRGLQMGRGPGLSSVSRNLEQGAWRQPKGPGLGYLCRSQAQGGWRTRVVSIPRLPTLPQSAGLGCLEGPYYQGGQRTHTTA